jgi:hypothetical protein
VVALEFGMARWRLERKRVTGAKDAWPSPWQGHRRLMGTLKTSYCDVVEHLGTWHPIGTRLTPASLSGPAVRQGWGGTAAGPMTAPRLIQRQDLFIVGNICTPSARIATSARIMARSSPAARSRHLKIFCLLYHQVHIQSA